MRIFSVFILASLVWSSAFADLPVELQWVFCAQNPQNVTALLGLPAPTKLKVQKIYYLETMAGDLEARQVFIKFRQRGDKVKSAVKARFRSEREIPADYKKSPHHICEKDVYNDEFRFSCAVKHEGDDFSLSAEQMKFLSDRRVARGRLHEAYLLGPLSGVESEFSGDIQLEEMSTPLGHHVSELSARVPARDETAAHAGWNARIAGARLYLCPQQSGKRSVVLRELWQSGSYEPYSPR